MLSVDGQRAAYLALHELAHEVAGGRWVATGGGGYALVDVVPRAWTPPAGDRGRARRSTRRRPRRRPGATYVAGAAAAPTAPTPDDRRPDAPTYRDWREGYDPDAWLDREVHATRTAVFPLHGLDPLP